MKELDTGKTQVAKGSVVVDSTKFKGLIDGLVIPDSLSQVKAPVPKVKDTEKEALDRKSQADGYKKYDAEVPSLGEPVKNVTTLPVDNARTYQSKLVSDDKEKPNEIFFSDKGDYQRSALVLDRRTGYNQAFLAVNEGDSTVKLTAVDKSTIKIEIKGPDGKVSGSYDYKIQEDAVVLKIEGNAKGLKLDLKDFDASKLERAGEDMKIQMLSPAEVQVAKGTKDVQVAFRHEVKGTVKSGDSSKVVYSGTEVTGLANSQFGEDRGEEQLISQMRDVSFANNVTVSLPLSRSDNELAAYNSSVVAKAGNEERAVSVQGPADGKPGDALEKLSEAIKAAAVEAAGASAKNMQKDGMKR